MCVPRACERWAPLCRHNPQVALAALKGDKTLAELVQALDVNATQIVEWKQQMVDRAAEVFGEGSASKAPAQPNINVLHAKIHAVV